MLEWYINDNALSTVPSKLWVYNVVIIPAYRVDPILDTTFASGLCLPSYQSHQRRSEAVLQQRQHRRRPAYRVAAGTASREDDVGLQQTQF